MSSKDGTPAHIWYTKQSKGTFSLHTYNLWLCLCIHPVYKWKGHFHMISQLRLIYRWHNYEALVSNKCYANCVYDFIGQCIAHWTDCNSVLKWFCCVILLKIGNYNTPIVRYTLTGIMLLVWRVWSECRWIDVVIELLKTVCYSKIIIEW